MVEDALLNIGFALARIFGFVANAFLFGLPVVYLIMLVPALGGRELPELVRKRMAKRISGLTQSALIASAVATIVAIILQAVVIADFGGGRFGTSSLTDVFDTSFGRWYLLRFPLLLALTVLVWGKAASLASSEASNRRTGFLLAWSAVGLVLLSTSSFSGHAAVSSPRTLALLNDVVHMAAGSVWFVGIVFLAVVAPDVRRLIAEDERTPFLKRLVVRFSSIALVAIGVVALTGTFNSLFNVKELEDLGSSGYGGLLSAKVTLFLVLLASGAVNHFFVRKRFRTASSVEEGRSVARLFKKTIGLELAIALLIFGITGALAGSARTRESAVGSPVQFSRRV